MDGATLILMILGGILLGAGATAALIGGYVWIQRQSPRPVAQPDPEAGWQQEKTISGEEDELYFPPPPERRDDPNSESTLPPNEDSQAFQQYRTFEHQSDPGMGMPWLDGIGGMLAGQRIKITRNETLIGRSRVCDVQFHDPKVSRQHSLLRLYQGRYFIQDMQSSRGTLVNGRRVQTHMLQDGDEIRLGDSVVIFRLPRQRDQETQF